MVAEEEAFADRRTEDEEAFTAFVEGACWRCLSTVSSAEAVRSPS